jgi:hypothetical protein
MDITPTLLLAPQLAAAVTERAALIAGGATLTDYAVMALDKQARVLAADLTAALNAPQTIQPWRPDRGRGV